MQQFKYIELQKEGGVAVAWLNKPKANTYDLDLMRDFNNLVEDVRFGDRRDAAAPAPHREIEGDRHDGHRTDPDPGRSPRVGAREPRVGRGRLHGRGDEVREGAHVPRARGPRRGPDQAVRRRGHGDVDQGGPRPRAGAPEPSVRDGGCEGGVPGVPREAEGDLPGEVRRRREPAAGPAPRRVRKGSASAPPEPRTRRTSLASGGTSSRTIGTSGSGTSARRRRPRRGRSSCGSTSDPGTASPSSRSPTAAPWDSSSRP